MPHQRRSIRETVENGINNLEDLQESLLTAIQLEFSTIPPYLCAQWSINSDPSNVASMIKAIAVQEMLHFGLGCNMYTATGGSLKGELATPDFVPVYPSHGLPGGVHPGLTVSLQPLSSAALNTFMSIEYPDGPLAVVQPSAPPPPAPPTPPTIGQFYQAISAGFQTVFPSGSLPNNPSRNQVQTDMGSDELFAVNTVADALNAIQEITEQGEGTTASPDEGTFDPKTLAHYYTFAELYYGKTVAQVGDHYEYSGPPLAMPTVHNFAPQPPRDPDQNAFIEAFSAVIGDLEACWTSSFSIDTAISEMFSLRKAGTALIQAGATPQFVLA